MPDRSTLISDLFNELGHLTQLLLEFDEAEMLDETESEVLDGVLTTLYHADPDWVENLQTEPIDEDLL